MRSVALSHFWRITVRALQIAAAAVLAMGGFLREWRRLRRSGRDALTAAAGRRLVGLCTRDYDAYEREVIALVDSLYRRGLGTLQVTVEIGRIFDVLRRHRIHARSHMTMVNLALMAAEGLGKRLDPDLSLTDEALPYLAEAIAGSALRAPDPPPPP
jgi:predicted unusual protein kinase regulating ubiquinone biosynthesis (AarF/ABC1/UbiB family)